MTRIRWSARLGLLALLGLVFSSGAAHADATVVAEAIAKVGVEKVIRVELGEATPGAKTRQVRILTTAAFPKCVAGPVWFYKEGALEDSDYYSFWAAESAGCPAGHTGDLVFTLNLPVGKRHSLVLRGPGRYDQRVSFQLDPEKVASLMIKKMIAR